MVPQLLNTQNPNPNPNPNPNGATVDEHAGHSKCGPKYCFTNCLDFGIIARDTSHHSQENVTLFWAVVLWSDSSK